MREIAALFEKGFTQGLRTYSNHPRNTDSLVECMDMIPNPLGVVGRPNLFDPFAGDFVVEWPFPLLLRGIRYTLLVTRTKVYSVGENWDMVALGDVTFTDQPHIADFGDTIYFASPGASYLLTPTGFEALSERDMHFSTCVNFGGQLIIANGSVPKGVALRELPEGEQSPETRYAVDEGVTAVEGQGIIAWSKINVLDFTFDLSAEAGFSYALWNGQVLRLLPLGNEIVVYGDAGIAKMVPFREPIASYGFSSYAKFGILNRNAVAGDGQTHICIGNDLSLYAIKPTRVLSDQGYAPQQLGYREYIEKLINPVVTFEPIHRHWWICGENAALVLSESGLGQSSDTSTGVVSVNGIPTGVVKNVGPRGAVITTDTISFGTRGIKLLAAIELDMESKADAYCQVKWRVDYRVPLADGARIFIDPRGTVFPTAAGTEFRVSVQAADFASLFLSKLRLRYKTVDKMSTRGVVNAGKIAE